MLDNCDGIAIQLGAFIVRLLKVSTLAAHSWTTQEHSKSRASCVYRVPALASPETQHAFLR